MKNLHMALLDFWNSFEWNGQQIPAFPAGRVPDDQPFPYFTFEVQQGAYFSTGFPTAHIWCLQPMDNSYNVQAQRAEIMDAVAARIPHQSGLMMTFDGGGVRIRRNESNFMSYYDPEQDDNIESPTGEPVIGGRFSLEMTYFV